MLNHHTSEGRDHRPPNRDNKGLVMSHYSIAFSDSCGVYETLQHCSIELSFSQSCNCRMHHCYSKLYHELGVIACG